MHSLSTHAENDVDISTTLCISESHPPQLAGLLSSFTTITSETLVSLGSLAVGLSPSVLENINGSILKENLQSLSTINNWSATQASIIVSKCKVQSDKQINADTLKQLGSLVIGVQSAEIKTLKSDDILSLANNSILTGYMEKAPIVLKKQFVQGIIQATSKTKKTIFQVVPAELASEIPVSNLLDSNLNVSEINQMKWTSSQAQVFFINVITKVTDFSTLSVNILQGFTCGAAKSLSDGNFFSLVKAMNGKAVKLESNQLSCMAKRLSKITNLDSSSLPNDVLLFLSPITNQAQCKSYFTRVGQANIDLLPQGSPKRNTLLSNAKSCLNINSNIITKDNLVILGSLVCDLTDKEIISSDSYVLDALKICSSFTDSQKVAIVTKLKAQYGAPSKWTLSNMKQIGSLSSALDSEIMKTINKSVMIKFFPGLLSVLRVQHKTTFTSVITQLKNSSRIAARDSLTCEEKLTTDSITKQMDLIVARYSAAQLNICTSNETLLNNLNILGSLAFDDDQLKVFKGILDMVR
ncbi:mesothelin-like [Pyxicephalus adspersus]|uniref:mesothelin-like n=1 Tax=Pyxicephalus adspersus TaxID=30357 RepID=UPI003B58DDDE